MRHKPSLSRRQGDRLVVTSGVLSSMAAMSALAGAETAPQPRCSGNLRGSFLIMLNILAWLPCVCNTPCPLHQSSFKHRSCCAVQVGLVQQVTHGSDQETAQLKRVGGNCVGRLRLTDQKGGRPLSMTYTTTPKDHMSQLVP